MRLGILVLAAGLVAACGHADQNAAPPRAAVTASAQLGLQVRAPADTPWVTERPHPSRTYGSYAKARRHFETLVKGVLRAYADSTVWLRTETDFLYQDQVKLERSIKGDLYWTVSARPAASHVAALVVTLRSTDAHIPSVLSVRDAFEAAGWAEDYVYSADGPDGTAFAYVCREALCYARAEWDGGDDSDTTYVPAPGVYLQLLCLPRDPSPSK